MFPRFGVGLLLAVGISLLPSCGKFTKPWNETTLSPRAATSTLVGRAAAPIDELDLEGNRLRLSDFRGQVVVLHFWGHW